MFRIWIFPLGFGNSGKALLKFSFIASSFLLVTTSPNKQRHILEGEGSRLTPNLNVTDCITPPRPETLYLISRGTKIGP